MQVDLFRMCMMEIDHYLDETTGIDEMQWPVIESNISPAILGRREMGLIHLLVKTGNFLTLYVLSNATQVLL